MNEKTNAKITTGLNLREVLKGQKAHDKKYPEHAKLRALDGKNNVIGDFVTWLQEKCGYRICELPEYERGESREYMPVTKRLETLLAEYFGIDENKLEAEKMQMLDEIRKANKQ